MMNLVSPKSTRQKICREAIYKTRGDRRNDPGRSDCIGFRVDEELKKRMQNGNNSDRIIIYLRGEQT
jgi:hypothetical protein